MNQNKFYKLVLFRAEGIGPATYYNLIQKYGNAEEAIHSLNLKDDFIDSVKQEIDSAESLGAEFIFDDDNLYPNALKSIKNASPIITALGNLESLKKSTIGVVGTRHASLNGMNFIRNLSCDLSKNNFVVVSGMAIGIDSAAHLGALDSGSDSATIAVLAGGLDKIWPLENESLYYKIKERGCLVSDMPIGTTPIKQYFVKRNALIAGLSEKLVLAEANLSSGSMITANHILNMGRRIYAIPGHPSDPRSAGPNRFISEYKAVLCESSETIIGKKSEKEKDKNIKLKLFEESPILAAMSSNVISENELVKSLNMPISDIKKELVVLEIEGKIVRVDGGYVLAN